VRPSPSARLAAAVGLGWLLALATLVALSAVAPRTAAAATVDEDTVREIASELRCVVCQSLSVADSPSETAHQMRGIIRERLAAGDTPEQVKAYFVEKYGSWILLSPPARGFDLLVWVLPYAALAFGIAAVVILVRRWSRRPRASIPEAGVDDAMRARISRDLSDLDRR
jgi:cytochrome c-type biogenesis protein CcmH